MGIQDRDYYRDELRRKQGYVERSSFRRPLAKSNTDVGSWMTLFGWLALAVAVAVALLMAIRRFV